MNGKSIILISFVIVSFISISVEVRTIGATQIEFFIDIVEFLIIRIPEARKGEI